MPESLGGLTALTELNLSDTRLTALPGWLGNLPGLQTLNLDGTELADSGFGSCPTCAR